MATIFRLRYLWLLVGLLIGLYLTAVHYGPVPVACPATGVVNCVAVLHSSGSMLGPLPLALWGVFWILGGAVVPRRLWWFWGLMGLGGLVWAIGHELSIGHLCLWCTAFQIDIGLVFLAFYPRSSTSR